MIITLMTVVIGYLGATTALLFQLPALCALCGAAIFGAACRRPRTPVILDWVCVVVLAFLAAYILIRAATSQVAYNAYSDEVLLWGFVVTFLFGAFFVDGTDAQLSFVGALVLLGLANVGVSIYQLKVDLGFSPLTVFGYTRPVSPGVEAMSGFFVLHNHFAEFLSMTTLALLGVTVTARMSVGWRLFLSFVTVLLVIGITLSRSRAGLSCFVVGLLVVAVLRSRLLYQERGMAIRRGVWLAFGGVATTAVAAFAWFAWQQLRGRFLDPSLVLAGKDVRLSLSEIAWNQFQSAKAWGTGGGSFSYECNRFWPTDFTQSVPEPKFAHNDWLQFLAEYGLVGFALLALFLIFVMFRRSKVQRQRDKSDQHLRDGIRIGMIAAVCSVSLHSVIDFSLRSFVILYMVAFMLGVLACKAGARQKSSRTGRVGSRLILVFMILMSLLGMRFVVSKFPSEYDLALGHREIARESPLGAVRAFQEATHHDPTNYEAMFMVGEVLFHYSSSFTFPAVRRSYLKQALDSFVETLKVHPWHHEAILKAAQANFSLGDYDLAEQYFIRGLEVAPMRSESHVLYGRFLLHKARRLQAGGDRAGAVSAVISSIEHLENVNLASRTDLHKLRRPSLVETNVLARALGVID